MDAYRKPIDMIVVGGYLGAGKTTLLNHVLAHAHGCRITVLVNDFGDINIDASLIRARTDDVINLENGCICCSIGGRLADALIAISSREDRPDLLIIEASGVSDPARIAQVGMLDRAFRLCGIVVVVDTERVQATLSDPYVGDIVRRQIASATALVLAKVDLVSEDEKNAAKREAGALAPRAAIVESVNGRVPPGLFFDAGAVPRNLSGAAVFKSVSGHGGHADIRSFSLRSDNRFDKEKLRQVFRNLPAGILRAKGIVWLEQASVPHELHAVGGRVLITPFSGTAEAASAFVFIGCFDDADEREIARRIEDAKSGVAATDGAPG